MTTPLPRKIALIIVALGVLLILLGKTISAAYATSKTSLQNIAAERYALVIGIDQYRKFPPLEHAVADAQLLSQQFKKLGYKVKQLRNYEADPDYVLETVLSIARQMDAGAGRENGTLLISFSGHGFRQDDTNYLAMGNSDPAKLKQSALSIKRIRKVLERSKIAQQVLFIDACRNDPGRAVDAQDRSFQLDTSARGSAIFYSTGAGQLSWEDSTLGQGVFSHYLAKGLSGYAANDSGVIQIDQLYEYVSRKVSTHIFDKYDREQIPYLAGERNANFTIGKAAFIPDPATQSHSLLALPNLKTPSLEAPEQANSPVHANPVHASLLHSRQHDCRKNDVLRFGYQQPNGPLVQFAESLELPNGVGSRMIDLRSPFLIDSFILTQLGTVVIEHTQGGHNRNSLELFDIDNNDTINSIASAEGNFALGTHARIEWALLPGVYCYYLGGTEKNYDKESNVQLQFDFIPAD